MSEQSSTKSSTKKQEEKEEIATSSPSSSIEKEEITSLLRSPSPFTNKKLKSNGTTNIDDDEYDDNNMDKKENGKEGDDNDDNDNASCTSSSSTTSSSSKEEMPFLKYGRIQRHDTSKDSKKKMDESNAVVVASVLGYGICPPPSSRASSTTANTLALADYTPSELSFHILGLGYDNGKIHLLDVAIQSSVLENALEISISTEGKRISVLSFDSSGKYFAAINCIGDVAIWEINFQYVEESDGMMRRMLVKNSYTPIFRTSTANSGSCIPTCIALDPAYGRTSTTPAEDSSMSSSTGWDIVKESRMLGSMLSQTVPLQNNVHKAICIGYSNGKIIIIKKGRLFGRRNDVILNQEGSGDEGMIINLVWRGSLIAWADLNTIHLYDLTTNSKLAHMNKPGGARISLFPSVQSMKCHLLFETSKRLLVGWGDCIMTISIQDVDFIPTTDSGVSAMPVKQRKVICDMAWELECVACGIAPVDSDHIAVLGLVPAIHNHYDHDQMDSQSFSTLLELQIIHRSTGATHTSDAMTLHVPTSNTDTPNKLPAASEYNLLSSFALPKMEDSSEAEMGMAQYLAAVSNTMWSNNAQEQEGYKDSHLRWNIQQASYESQHSSIHLDYDHEDTDILRFLFPDHNAEGGGWGSTDIPSPPPIMVITSPYDIVLVQTRDIDDAISYHQSQHKYDLALRAAIQHRRMIRRHSLSNVIDQYISFLLKLHPFQANDQVSLCHLKHVLRILPTLLGGDSNMWEAWLTQVFAKHIHGSLFLLYKVIPVRDPKLPTTVYEICLKQMLHETMTFFSSSSPKDDEDQANAATKTEQGWTCQDIYITTLRSWGATYALSNRISSIQQFVTTNEEQPPSSSLELNTTSSNNNNQEFMQPKTKNNTNNWLYNLTPTIQQSLLNTIDTLHSLYEYRSHQSSSEYLSPSFKENTNQQTTPYPLSSHSTSNKRVHFLDALYTIDIVQNQHLLPILNSTKPENNIVQKIVVLEALGEIYYMKGQYDKSLSMFLFISVLLYYQKDTDTDGCLDDNTHYFNCKELEEDAVRRVNTNYYSSTNPTTVTKQAKQQHTKSSYHHIILPMVEYHFLQQCLLSKFFFPSFLQQTTASEDSKQSITSFPPIVALVFLIGLDLSGDFLIKYTSLSSNSSSQESSNTTTRTALNHQHDKKDIPNNLPLDIVSSQLKSVSPKLLYWYLHLLFTNRPELYYCNTTSIVYTPPKVILDLHYDHLNLFLDFANTVIQDEKEEKKKLVRCASSIVGNEEDSPFMTFLKATIPIGGIRIREVRLLLEARRASINNTTTASQLGTNASNNKNQNPHIFARELAYIMECSDSGSEEDAKSILQLYLDSTKSLYLAVAYAQRNQTHSIILWQILVHHCVAVQNNNTASGDTTVTNNNNNTSLFGELLESAALYGADLSQIIKQIPQGMIIEGIRPKLVSAVSDYKLQVKMYEYAANILVHDKVSLVRECIHRSRRALRVDLTTSSSSAGARK